MARRARNPLDRRADKLAAEMTRREGSVYTKLTDPAPAFMVRKSEMDSVRDYLRVRANPQGLHQLRDQYGDDAVDQYVSWAENALAKYLPQIMAGGSFPDPDGESEFTDSPTFENPEGIEDTNPFGPVSAEG